MAPALAPPLGLLNMGPLEITLIAVAAVVLFGGDLPSALRKAGGAVRKLRDAASDVTRAVYEAGEEEDARRLAPPDRPHPSPGEETGPAARPEAATAAGPESEDPPGAGTEGAVPPGGGGPREP